MRPEVLEEAATWLVEFRAGEPEAADRRDFDHWLRASPEHVRAYLTLLPTWENDTLTALTGDTSLDSLIHRARRSENNVVPYGQRTVRRAVVARWGRKKMSFAAAGVWVALGVGAYFASDVWRNPVYSTATGEQISVVLQDGTTVSLNSRSTIRIRYSPEQRNVELTQGQALFQVAKDAARPFIVSSDTAQIRAIGTQFDVYRKKAGTTVTVVEGRVAVAQVLLTAGEQITVTPKFAPRPTQVDTKVATAWIQRRLIFSAASLTEVAAEFNRYNTRRLVIGSGKLENLRINGVFSSADPVALLNFLRAQPSIEVVETAAEIRVSQK